MTALPPDALQRLLREADFVRLLARTLLADEADEVVQQTWLRAVRHGGSGIDAPRSWLARIVRNVAHNMRRRRNRQRRHEALLAGQGLVPSSAELMQLEEQRRVLLAAIDRLPAELRTVVLLRYFDGRAPRRIAAELGVSSMTVRNRLRRALQLLRERLDAQHGGERRAWMVPLVPFAWGSREGAAVAMATAAAGTGTVTLGLGVLAMTMQAKLAAAALVLVASVGAFLLWQRDDGLPAAPPRGVAALDDSAPASGDLRTARGAVSVVTEPERREAVTATPTGPTTGSLVVHARYGDDGTPAAFVTMIACREGTDARFDGIRVRTDAAGTATFPALLPGPVFVNTDRAGQGGPLEIVAGETAILHFTFRDGITIHGTVVAADGVAVAGAMVEVAWVGRVDADAEHLATTGADGTFVVRSAPYEGLVGARAGGHAASRLQSVSGKIGSRVDVKLQLGPPAGVVEGFVVDDHDRPVADAIVRVGKGRTNGLPLDGAPLPARSPTDENGRFRTIGVLPGAQPVAVRARGFAPWTGTCEVQALATVPLRIVLQPGAALYGTVRDAAGAPVPGIEVEIGEWTELTHHLTTTNARGEFELAGLAAGPTVVCVSSTRFGNVQHHVVCVAGQRIACDLQLSRGRELQGRVFDEAGAPVDKARIDAYAPGTPSWAESVLTDAEGRFAVPNCPEDRNVDIAVSCRGYEVHNQKAIAVTDAQVRFVLRRAPPPSAHVRGQVVDAEGAPLANATIHVHRAGESTTQTSKTAADGAFAFGPLVPGTWTVSVRCDGRPFVRLGPHQLAPEATWDLGQVLVPRGGRAVVVPGDDAVRLLIWDAAGTSSSGLTVTETPGERISRWLAPGDYRLYAWGKSVAAQSIPFAIRADETTRVPLALLPGVRQGFALAPAVPERAPRSVQLRIHRGEQFVAHQLVTLEATSPTSTELWLLPGDYRVVATAADRELASAVFTVGAAEGPPLQLVLR